MLVVAAAAGEIVFVEYLMSVAAVVAGVDVDSYLRLDYTCSNRIDCLRLWRCCCCYLLLIVCCRVCRDLLVKKWRSFFILKLEKKRTDAPRFSKWLGYASYKHNFAT